MGSPELFAVLMAGGSGTRFWPASRRKLPKQYLPIGTDEPLIRVTFERLAGLVDPARVLVVASKAHARLVREILPEIPAENLLLEPVGRNTTPCIAWAASTIAARAPASVQVVLPSDHVIHPAQEFRALLEAAAREAAQQEVLITLGVHPTSPATGYGYIERGPEQPGLLQPVQRFVEKPARELAEQFVASGHFLWNAGIFVWSTRAILAALREFAPRTLEGAQELGRAPDESSFARLESIAIDRSVMERARNVRVIPMRLQWSDVGAWDALGAQNGGGELVALESSNCISWAGPGELVALLGVEDLVVVHAGKATLVCPRARAQDIRMLVAELERRGSKLL